MKILLSILFSALFIVTYGQTTQIDGKITGKAAEVVKEIQIICDGRTQKMQVNKDDKSFSGALKISEPQFVEIKAGNPKGQYYYLLPNETLKITIDKPTLPESITIIDNKKIRQVQEIFDSYFVSLREQGVNTSARDWQQLLFLNPEPINAAENVLKQKMAANNAMLAGIPNFKRDANLFMNSFRKYSSIDQMSLAEIDSSLLEIKAAKLKKTSINIPFLKEYLTDLTNAYSARTLEKYGIEIDFLKQRHTAQFLAAEAINEHIEDSFVKSMLFSEKINLELATNGLKNEAFVNYLIENSNQGVKDFYKERLEQLQANKTPDLNSPRKRAFDFLLHDSTGKEYRLDDFKGKMVFVDFWASWCAPCKAQIPHQKELEKKYAGKDLIFMSVSLDKSKEAWLKAVGEEDLHGYVLHAEGDFKNPLPRAYDVDAIPRYMLIDAEGNIISDNMIKPQNKKEISGIIDEELYAKNTGEILEKHFKAIGAEKITKQGLSLEYRQSIPGFSSANTVLFNYPDKVKHVFNFESNEQMLLMLGEEFFKEKQMIINGDKITTNNPVQSEIKYNWVNKIFGFELFLRKNHFKSVVKFAEENATENGESYYVLKVLINGSTEKYYINKKTYLIEKIVVLQQVQPRTGAGTMEVVIKYEDYKNIEGLMVPFKANMANIITFKVEKASLTSMDASVFE
jgi:thiol-disulfide isomerase/thioredoxin